MTATKNHPQYRHMDTHTKTYPVSLLESTMSCSFLLSQNVIAPSRFSVNDDVARMSILSIRYNKDFKFKKI